MANNPKNIMEELSSTGMLESKIANEKGVVVYFYSDRCAPCISLRPKVKSLVEKEFPEMKLVFVNSENHPEIPAQYGVFANPCILVFFEGKEFNRYSKYISAGQLSYDIQRVYSMVFDI
jgi:thioredoxin 1